MTDATTATKTFILGLGAQKSGTSWLFDYLASSGLVATHRIKEYHVWDALCIPGMGHALVRKEDSENGFSNRVRYFLQQSPDNYFDYFAHMMNQQAKNVTCDITPLYSGLERGTLKLIRDGFGQRGISTRPVFLMRDPVERCWSAARMESRNEKGHTSIGDDEVVQHALSALAGVRTRYDITVGEIEAVFPQADAHLGIYEEMFDAQRLQELSELCRVPVRPALAERRVNVSRISTPISDAAASRIAAHYRLVYAFAATRFPQTLRLWRGFRYL